jgi:hypothetical protein
VELHGSGAGWRGRANGGQDIRNDGGGANPRRAAGGGRAGPALAVIPGMDLRICQAIAERRLLMFGYGGAVRVVEPHLYGVTTADHEALSAWMRPGWSRVDPEGGWRMYRTDGIVELQLLPEQFEGARPDFNPRDPHFTEIFCRLTPELPEMPDASATDGGGEAPREDDGG